MSAAPVPADWPAQVHPPGAPDWERSAVAWLFDQCPPDYRAYDVLRRHPLALARFAAIHLDAALEAARTGFRTARAEFAAVVPPETVESILAAFEREGRRVARARRQVDLVERALRGGRYVPRL